MNCADARTLSLVLAFLCGLVPGGAAVAQEYSLRTYGHGVSAPDLDRAKIAVDDPANSDPGPPSDIGATDFTLEFFVKGSAADNAAGSVACGANNNWILGNIVVDRDRYNQDRKFGISLAGGEVVFGVSGDGTGDRTVCSTSDVLDQTWHHVAVQRRRADGRLWLFVDGALEAEVDGPDGDLSYPDDGVPCATCCDGNPCDFSDPYLVIGAEKHDAGAAYPSFSGWVDELRLSTSLRYNANFTPPSAAFIDDADTAALYHFDEGPAGACTGSLIDASAGNQSPGVCRHGGSAPAGPEYSTDTPFDDTPTTHDAVVVPLSPITAKIQPDKNDIERTIRVAVTNGDSMKGTSQTVQLAITDSDCPVNLVAGGPDFDGRTAGDQDTVTLGAGRSRSALVRLFVDGTQFTTFNRHAPLRCTLEFTATSIAPNNTDPTPDNNVAHLEFNLFDFADVPQTAVHESVIESFRASHPGKIEIRAGLTQQTKLVKVAVSNADADEEPGDLLSVAVDQGDCPPGTIGAVDFDRDLAGPQSSVIVRGERETFGFIEVVVNATDFLSPSRRSLARCTAVLSVSGPGGDSDASNNVTRMVINVFDRNDL